LESLAQGKLIESESAASKTEYLLSSICNRIFIVEEKSPNTEALKQRVQLIEEEAETASRDGGFLSEFLSWVVEQLVRKESS